MEPLRATSSDKSAPAAYLLRRLAQTGDADGVAHLLAEKEMPTEACTSALVQAAERGHIDCVRLLIPFSGDMGNDSIALALVRAAGDGHAECVEVLVPVCGAESINSALAIATRHGHADCVKLLISIPGPKVVFQQSLLYLAAAAGHVECVKLLIPVSDPMEKDSVALRSSIINRHTQCAKLLIPVSGQLVEIPSLLSLALVAGQAEVVALLLESEPRLLDGVDLFEILSSARSTGNDDVAEFLSSVIDRDALSSAVPKDEARPSSFFGRRL